MGGDRPATQGCGHQQGEVSPRKVYPRPCGETNSDQIGRRRDSGSEGLSPPMRGNLAAGVACAVGRGSIPAHAGKPLCLESRLLPLQVYPRPCGETPQPPPLVVPIKGLSPPMRGNLLLVASRNE